MHERADKVITAVAGSETRATPEAAFDLAENPRVFSLWERFQIFLASWIGTLAVWLVGRSLRFEIYGWENWEAAQKLGRGIIYAFWHREIFAATWFWRKRGIVVMTSPNFDGEYIARIIQRHGFGAARGSSSRGAVRAFVEMKKVMAKGRDAAFTIDGPRGPRFVAKAGPVVLAKITGAAVVCFHIALRRCHVFRKSWDMNQIPYPFSRARVFIAPPITVSAHASDAELSSKLQEVQATQEDLVRQGDGWVGGLKGSRQKTGSA